MKNAEFTADISNMLTDDSMFASVFARLETAAVPHVVEFIVTLILQVACDWDLRFTEPLTTLPL